MSDKSPAGRAIEQIVKEGGIGEALHLEAFIAALNGVTPAEHAEAAVWLNRKRRGLEVGPPPPGITKGQTVAEVDERFWCIADEYRMHDTPFRLAFLMDMAVRMSVYHEKRRNRESPEA